MSVYGFKVRAQDGSEVSLSDYKGKVPLIVKSSGGCLAAGRGVFHISSHGGGCVLFERKETVESLLVQGAAASVSAAE